MSAFRPPPFVVSSTSFLKELSGFVSRTLGESNSRRRPASRTRMRSLSMMVCRRCAMVSTVQLLNAVRMVAWMRPSVALSTLEVASSSTRILEFRSSALAMQSSCLCPTLRLAPPSLMGASRPSCCSFTNESMPDLRSASQMSASDPASLKGSRLLRMVPLNTTGSWGTSDSRQRRSLRPMAEMSSPSMRMRPDAGSMMRYSVRNRVLLPHPVRPHTPTFSQLLTSRLRSFSTSSSSGL
mmetsp:Transcript_30325/g.67227  ORF Transcript_30325/g.67227 Transcript_30325/m.67227 type:complete len:239 (-) Transcript_30325:528-1244(-)